MSFDPRLELLSADGLWTDKKRGRRKSADLLPRSSREVAGSKHYAIQYKLLIYWPTQLPNLRRTRSKVLANRLWATGWMHTPAGWETQGRRYRGTGGVSSQKYGAEGALILTCPKAFDVYTVLRYNALNAFSTEPDRAIRSNYDSDYQTLRRIDATGRRYCRLLAASRGSSCPSAVGTSSELAEAGQCAALR